jgi:hypothetical protein
MNKNILNQNWPSVLPLFKEYKTLGIQIWKHDQYAENKCQGPYIRDWFERDNYRVLPWHPSRLGHELRAAHYAYFWILIFKDALDSLLGLIATGESFVERLDSDLKKHFLSEQHHLPQTPMQPSNFTDNIRCYTTLEPRFDESFALTKLILPTTVTGQVSNNQSLNIPWKIDLYDKLDRRTDIIRGIEVNGDHDKKMILYGNKDMQPLSLYTYIKRHGKLLPHLFFSSTDNSPLTMKILSAGYIFFCQCQGYGLNEYPPKFTYFWLGNTEVYLTRISAAQATEIERSLKNPLSERKVFQFDKGWLIIVVVVVEIDYDDDDVRARAQARI